MKKVDRRKGLDVRVSVCVFGTQRRRCLVLQNQSGFSFVSVRFVSSPAGVVGRLGEDLYSLLSHCPDELSALVNLGSRSPSIRAHMFLFPQMCFFGCRRGVVRRGGGRERAEAGAVCLDVRIEISLPLYSTDATSPPTLKMKTQSTSGLFEHQSPALKDVVFGICAWHLA